MDSPQGHECLTERMFLFTPSISCCSLPVLNLQKRTCCIQRTSAAPQKPATRPSCSPSSLSHQPLTSPRTLPTASRPCPNSNPPHQVLTTQTITCNMPASSNNAMMKSASYKTPARPSTYSPQTSPRSPPAKKRSAIRRLLDPASWRTQG